jgi:hypothetical protein
LLVAPAAEEAGPAAEACKEIDLCINMQLLVAVCICRGTALRADAVKYRVLTYLAAFRLQALTFPIFRCVWGQTTSGGCRNQLQHTARLQTRGSCSRLAFTENVDSAAR